VHGACCTKRVTTTGVLTASESKSLSAATAPPRTQLGELTMLPRSPMVSWDWDTPSPNSTLPRRPRLLGFGAFGDKVSLDECNSGLLQALGPRTHKHTPDRLLYRATKEVDKVILLDTRHRLCVWCRLGLVVSRWSRSTKLLYAGPG